MHVTARADARTAGIPVVGLTAHGTAANAHNFPAVCETVLEKPLNPEAVVEALRRAVNRQGAAD